MDIGLPYKGFSQHNHFNKLKYKVMRIKQTIGIDISKLTFDILIHSNQMFHQFENTNKGFKKLIKWVNVNNSFLKDETIFIFEHTVIYSYLLSVFLTEQQLSSALVPGLEIKPEFENTYAVTDASVHDSQALGGLLTEKDKDQDLHADSTCTGEDQDKIIEKYEMKNKVHEKGYRNRPLTEKQKASNTEKSKIRARVEHVFGFMEQSIKGLTF